MRDARTETKMGSAIASGLNADPIALLPLGVAIANQGDLGPAGWVRARELLG